MRVSVVLVLLLSSTAFADDVPPPQDDCPSGSAGETDHHGQYCAPLRCRNDEACSGRRYIPAGRVCRPAAFCVETRHYRSHRGHEGDYEVFQGPCDASGACETGECVRAGFCVDADDPLEPAATVTMMSTSMTSASMATSASMEPSEASESSETSASAEGESSCSAGHATGGAWLVLLCLVWGQRKSRSRASIA